MMQTVEYQDVMYVETSEPFANVPAQVLLLANRRACVQACKCVIHMPTRAYVHICAHVKKRVLNFCIIFIVGISLACVYVNELPYLYVWICHTCVIMHPCMICIACDIMIVHLETILLPTIKPIILMSMCISNLNLSTFPHIICDFSQYSRTLLMVASLTPVHLKPVWKSMHKSSVVLTSTMVSTL